MKKMLLLVLFATALSCFSEYVGGGGVSSADLAAEVAALEAVDATKVDTTNGVQVGTVTLTNTTSTAWSVGYWTNSVTGVGTNGVYVRKVYTPAGTTNTYYSLYQ